MLTNESTAGSVAHFEELERRYLDRGQSIAQLRADLEAAQSEIEELKRRVVWAEPNYSEDGRCTECGQPSEDHMAGRDCIRQYRYVMRQQKAELAQARVANELLKAQVRERDQWVKSYRDERLRLLAALDDARAAMTEPSA